MLRGMAHDSRLPFQRRLLPDGLGRTLRAAREAEGRSRRELATRVGIGPRTLARIERGAQKPLWPTLERLCEELGLSTFAVARTWAAQAMDLPESPSSAPGLGVRALRRERGLTLVEVAGRAGVSAATLSRFERGITASRLLAHRTGGPEVAADDRGVALDARRLAPAFGFEDAEEFRKACLAAHAEAHPDAP